MLRGMSAVVAAVLLSIPAELHAEPVASATRAFAVTYAKGSSESYRYVYDADIGVASKESGVAADPLRARFIDTRRCDWSVKASVLRSLYLVNKAGQQFQKGEPVQVLTPSSGYLVSSQSKGSCAGAAPQIDRQSAALKEKLKAQIESIASEDFKRVLPTLTDMFGANRIAPR